MAWWYPIPSRRLGGFRTGARQAACDKLTLSPLQRGLLVAFYASPTLDTCDARPSRPSVRDLGQVLVAVEVVTEDDTVGCDLVLAREWVMGAPAGLEYGQCAFEPGVSPEELEQDHVV